MAGHSKWANIQHRKGAQDAKRGKLFTKLIREITVAARMGDPNPASNPRLRLAVDKALTANMTRDTIDRAIKRGSGAQDNSDFIEIVYEGYAPGGVAVLVESMTDNRNRTVAEVRHAFTKCGGNMGTEGSVAYLFSKTGQITFEPGSDENRIMEIAIEAGADDIQTFDDGSVEVLTSPESFEAVLAALKQAKLEPVDAEVTMRAATLVPVDAEMSQRILKLQEMLEDLDDVQNVFMNADLVME